MRKQEVIETDSNNPRLTITPTRITLKYNPNKHKEILSILLKLAMKADKRINESVSLRGKYREDKQEFSVWSEKNRICYYIRMSGITRHENTNK